MEHEPKNRLSYVIFLIQQNLYLFGQNKRIPLFLRIFFSFLHSHSHCKLVPSLINNTQQGQKIQKDHIISQRINLQLFGRTRCWVSRKTPQLELIKNVHYGSKVNLNVHNINRFERKSVYLKTSCTVNNYSPLQALYRQMLCCCFPPAFAYKI